MLHGLWVLVSGIVVTILFASTVGLTFFSTPHLGRIDAFGSYAQENISITARAMQVFLWSIPVHSLLFFVSCIDLQTLHTPVFVGTRMSWDGFASPPTRNTALAPFPTSDSATVVEF